MTPQQIAAVKGRGIVVRGNDVDTDRIIPARYLREITFARMGEYAFYDERFGAQGKVKTHPFNDPRFQGASILVVNENFGCGSSREHAPQALMRWGIQAIVGESFADIFSGNCGMLGVPTIYLAKPDVERLMDFIEAIPGAEIEVDLEKKVVKYGDVEIQARINESMRESLVKGTWDTTSLMLEAKDEIRKTASALPYLTNFVS
ncbi:MAG: 3-isopropylmalate dehydratase small subunit [Anaerolineae bacterium]|nr:3-isopropylmalate dehydratase small subunit [Anaerolineae bacterium]